MNKQHIKNLNGKANALLRETGDILGIFAELIEAKDKEIAKMKHEATRQDKENGQMKRNIQTLTRDLKHEKSKKP